MEPVSMRCYDNVSNTLLSYETQNLFSSMA